MFSSKTLQITGLLGLALAGVMAVILVFTNAGVPVAASPAQQGSYPANTITVSGSGSATGTPDVAYLQLGLEIVLDNLGAAVEEADTGMNAIIAAIQDAGVAAEDIQTANTRLTIR